MQKELHAWLLRGNASPMLTGEHRKQRIHRWGLGTVGTQLRSVLEAP
jgi:hypothetical protein